MLPSEGHLTTDDGVRLFFRRVGTGSPVVIVPNGIHLCDDFEPLADTRTLIFFDLRNRGRSDRVSDAARLSRGVQHDVEDIEAVRRHAGAGPVAVIGHSYVGLTVVLYAMRYPDHADRIVQLGPIQPHYGKQYPAHLMCADATLKDVLAGLAALEKERSSLDPTAFCRKFWSLLRVLYVANPADADKIKWDRCDLPNERTFMAHWLQNIVPSLQALNLTAEAVAMVKAPVLIIHGTKDRSAPYGGGREWASTLPDARLVTVEESAHGPWIEAPALVFDSLKIFLDGAWPEAAERVPA
jgi:pimeloyl-ACP methyl ester carboxylesterase